MKPLVMDGIEYDREYTRNNRDLLIILREGAIRANHLDWAMVLSEIIAILNYYMEQIEK